jgi:Leucine-rich repeat (LRR) protein
MNKETKIILENYDTTSIELDLSNKNIQRTLSLNKFKKLEKINCSNNQITSLIAIPKNIKSIKCSNNLIKEFTVFYFILYLTLYI